MKVTFYKDKTHILYNANKLKNTPFSVSEDFSKSTLATRSQLVSSAKRATVRTNRKVIEGIFREPDEPGFASRAKGLTRARPKVTGRIRP